MDNLTFLLSADFSVVCQLATRHVWLMCRVFLLLSNLPAYELANLSDFYGVSTPR